MTGSIPSYLGSLSNLQELDFGGNYCSGIIPTKLGLLSNLRVMDLAGNQLTGNFPQELGDLVNLQRLDLSSNQLSGNLPSSIGKLTSLTELYTGDNQLSGEIPSSITSLTGLTTLALSCGLTSSDPLVIAFLDEKSPGWREDRGVDNQPPENVIITAPTDPVQLGQSMSVSVTFSDPDAGDTHIITWDWGDGSVDSGSNTSAIHTYTQTSI